RHGAGGRLRSAQGHHGTRPRGAAVLVAGSRQGVIRQPAPVDESARQVARAGPAHQRPGVRPGDGRRTVGYDDEPGCVSGGRKAAMKKKNTKTRNTPQELSPPTERQKRGGGGGGVCPGGPR